MGVKNLIFGLMMTFALMSGCKEESAEPETPQNKMIYDGSESLIAEISIQDLKQNPHFPDHYFNVISLTDGKFAYYEDGSFVEIKDNTFMLSFHLYSPGTEAFKPGKFQYIKTSELSSAEAIEQVKGKFFIGSVIFTRIVGDNVERSTAAKGTVEVSGSPDAYNLEFDLTMHDGKTLTGNYSGSYFQE